MIYNFIRKNNKKKMNQQGKPFIVKLFEIFSKEDTSYKWTENGNILIINTYNFAENIMPKYYKSSSIKYVWIYQKK